MIKYYIVQKPLKHLEILFFYVSANLIFDDSHVNLHPTVYLNTLKALTPF